jgi:hypothetical protein
MGKYKFLLPNGEVAQVSAESFVDGLMKVCDQVGIRPLSASEQGEKREGVTKIINTKRNKEKHT